MFNKILIRYQRINNIGISLWILKTINYGIHSVAINITSCIANGQNEIVAVQSFSRNPRSQNAVLLGTLVSKII